MNLNFKLFFRSLGALMMVMGGVMIFPLIVSILYNELETAITFIVTIVSTLLIGLVIYFGITPTRTRLTARDGFLIVSVGWILASVVGAIPFIASGAIPNFFDAFFETSSGLTTTGATILKEIESLPKGILFWRSFTNWIGGMGILVFAVAFLPSLGIGANLIAASEAPGPTLDKITPKISDTAKRLYQIYLILTFLEVICLLLAGTNLYDALTHTFGSVGTGGFSNYNDSVAHFNSPLIDGIITTFMLLSAINFNLYFYAFKNKGGIKNLFADSEFKFYLWIVAMAILFITLNLFVTGIYKGIGESLRFSSFQVASILTTTGFMSADYDVWPTFSKMVLLILFCVGGCSSSTGGGIKVIRILVMLKLIGRGIAVRLHPNVIISVKINEKKLSIDTVSSIANFIFLYIATVLVGTILICLEGIDIVTSFSAVLTCIGNVGPGFNLVGPVNNFGFFSSPVKFLLSLFMLAGRLELFTFLMLFTRKFWLYDK
ncbi:TrkH family potassium uptake protein [Clostridium aminobutyricum]|uniref:TrkH family potassium uptake protein n=1 Tax=Clostridium aminobutyricum TaxID=33953 RepID=A0A939D6K2_CLOAM|nr:TrkH family potassium uptake protein [Clostridium aminobutyricum]MBN7772027.1 TrkH family potassium uptake protein [Clostridium aminobutyricum]